MMLDLRIYKTAEGKQPFSEWYCKLKDPTTRIRVEKRLDRLSTGYYGNYKSLGDGIYELRLFFGPGYRIYFGEDGDTVVVLLCGGGKSTQQRDIKKS